MAGRWSAGNLPPQRLAKPAPWFRPSVPRPHRSAAGLQDPAVVRETAAARVSSILSGATQHLDSSSRPQSNEDDEAGNDDDEGRSEDPFDQLLAEEMEADEQSAKRPRLMAFNAFGSGVPRPPMVVKPKAWLRAPPPTVVASRTWRPTVPHPRPVPRPMIRPAAALHSVLRPNHPSLQEENTYTTDDAEEDEATWPQEADADACEAWEDADGSWDNDLVSQAPQFGGGPESTWEKGSYDDYVVPFPKGVAQQASAARQEFDKRLAGRMQANVQEPPSQSSGYSSAAFQPKFGKMLRPQLLRPSPKGAPSPPVFAHHAPQVVPRQVAKPVELQISRSVDVPSNISQTVISDLSSTEFKVPFKIEESVYDGSCQVHFGPGPKGDVEEAVAMIGEHIEDLVSSGALDKVEDEPVPAAEEEDPVLDAEVLDPDVDDEEDALGHDADTGAAPSPAPAIKHAWPTTENMEEDVLSGDDAPDVVLLPTERLGAVTEEVAEKEPPQKFYVGLNSPDSPDVLDADEAKTPPRSAAAVEAVSATTPVGPRVAVPAAPGSPRLASAAVAASMPAQVAAPAVPQQMTVEDWLNSQDQFSHLPVLPKDWIRIKSSKGSIYYMNILNGSTSSEAPEAILPHGWEKVVSRSTQRVYYRNIQLGTSQFEIPTM